MANLREYFETDARFNLTLRREWPIGNGDGRELGKVVARLHFDFDAYAHYISFYIPDMDDVICPEALVLREIENILSWPSEVVVQAGPGSGELHDGRELRFTGQIYLYSERPVTDHDRERLIQESQAAGHHLTFRSGEYVNYRNKWERPRAFISHDSRDKTSIAQPLALELSKRMLTVWYDEYSLKVGDSLRESIEKGLRECERCVLILTPNFLKNGGWSKREYDSIFTRELIEKKKFVLPIWHEVTAREVFEYSPVLADRLGVNWSLGLEEVARRLQIAIESTD